MVETIEVARDMIRQLGEFVNTCDPKVPLNVYRTVERVQEAYEEKEIDHNIKIKEWRRIEELADMFNKQCSCMSKKTIDELSKRLERVK